MTHDVNSEAEVLKELEDLREKLYRFVGGQYAPEKFQEAREISVRLDKIIVEYARLQRSKGQEAKKDDDGR